MKQNDEKRILTVLWGLILKNFVNSSCLLASFPTPFFFWTYRELLVSDVGTIDCDVIELMLTAIKFLHQTKLASHKQ